MSSGLPIHDAVAADLARRAPTGRHRWHGDPIPLPTGGAPVAKHGDDDHDGVANHADPDWTPPDQRDLHATGDQGCDVDQQAPDRWVGVTRDPDLLPITPAADDTTQEQARG